MKKNPKICLLVVIAAMVVAFWITPAAGQRDAPANPTPAGEPATSSKNLLDFIQAGGPIGYAIILLSLVGVALVAEGFIHVKADKLLPPALVDQTAELARRKRFSELRSVCTAGDSMLARIISEGLSHGQLGLQAVRESMQESGVRELTRLGQRVGYIGFIASVAPMLGLLGTVTGMIGSFDVLGMSKGAARPDQLAVGISEAMVTTCMGLVVAVPLMFFHNYFRNRVTRLSQEASGHCERLMMSMTVAVEGRSPAKETDGASTGRE